MTHFEEFDAYVTKWCLTRGIQKMRLRHTSSKYQARGAGRAGHTLFEIGRDYHIDYAGARIRAEQMRLAKIKSLMRKITALQTPFPETEPGA